MATETALQLRDAASDDAHEIARIYGHYVQTSFYTFEEVPPDAAEMRQRLKKASDAKLPWRVATGSDGEIVGYAYAGSYRSRSAYRYTLEHSIYVAPERVNRGIGMTLMRDLIRECTSLGYRQMLAIIGDSANEASLRLHTRLGFRTIGQQLAVGYKFGRWVDVVQMQLALGDGARSLPGTEPVGYTRR
jgi:phosphinothricin acetyltransferase